MKYKFNIDKFIDDDLNGLSLKTLQTILSYITYKYCDFRNEGEWVNIFAKEFQSICNDYKPYLEYLRKKGIILIDYHYEVDKHSRRFCFNDNFKALCKVELFSEDTDIVYLDNNKCIPTPIKRKIEKDFGKLKVNTNIKKDLLFVRDDGVNVYDFKKYLFNYNYIKMIYNHKFFFKWIDDCRLYTPFVYLDEEVRLNNCYFNENEKLCNLDIRSSHPLFLSLWFLENGMDLNNYEFKEFKDGLKSGKFYDNLKYKLNKIKDRNNHTDIEKPAYSKKKAKDSFMLWLNGDNFKKNGIDLKNNDINYVFDKYYPELFELMTSYKTHRNTFFYILSQMESNFIFNNIIYKLYKQIKGIQIITCHDSIYFAEKYMAEVKPIWNEELNKLYDKLEIKDGEITGDYSPELFGGETFNYKKSRADKIKILDELLPT